MAAPVITFGLTNRVSRTTLTETVRITDDIGILTGDVAVASPALYKILKKQVSDTEVELTITIPVTGIIEITATDGDLDEATDSRSYIIDPLYDASTPLPFVSILGNSLEIVTQGDSYSEQGAIAFDSTGTEITNDIMILVNEPNSTGSIASGLDETAINVSTDTIDLGVAAPVADTVIFFSTVNGFEIASVAVDTQTIYYVTNPTGNTIQLSNRAGGSALDISSIGDGEIAIDTTNIIDGSDTGTTAILYKVKNSNGLFGNTASRMAIVKTDPNNIISPTNDLSTSNAEIRHSLAPQETRSWGIPFVVGRTTAPSSPTSSRGYATKNRYIEANGSISFTGNQSMGGFRLTNVSDAINDNDAVNLSQLNAIGDLICNPTIFEGTVASSSTSTVDTLAVADYRAVKWLLTLEDPTGGTYYASEFMAVNTASEVDYAEYSVVGDGGPYEIFAEIVGSNIELKITNPIPNIVNMKFIRFKVS